MSKMKVVCVEPLKPAYVKEIDRGLQSLQKEVDGYIEVINDFTDNQVVLICNEEGKIMGLPLNRGLVSDGVIYDIVAGTFLVVGTNGEEFDSLTDEQIERYLQKYSRPEEFVRINGSIYRIPMD